MGKDKATLRLIEQIGILEEEYARRIAEVKKESMVEGTEMTIS